MTAIDMAALAEMVGGVVDTKLAAFKEELRPTRGKAQATPATPRKVEYEVEAVRYNGAAAVHVRVWAFTTNSRGMKVNAFKKQSFSLPVEVVQHLRAVGDDDMAAMLGAPINVTIEPRGAA